MNLSSLDSFNRTLSIILVIFTMSAEVFVGLKVRMRLDWSMTTIALAYMLSFIFRTPLFNQGDLDLAQGYASMTIWAIMYFFVF